MADYSERFPELPEGAVINADIQVIQYINPEDGVLHFLGSFRGEVPYTQFVGLLVAGGIQLVQQQEEW